MQISHMPTGTEEKMNKEHQIPTVRDLCAFGQNFKTEHSSRPTLNQTLKKYIFKLPSLCFLLHLCEPPGPHLFYPRVV